MHLLNQHCGIRRNPFADRDLGADKRVGLLFLNPSLRTRLSTQVAAKEFRHGSHRVQCRQRRLGA
jgi:ornithine carbamoyltransferase